MDFETENRNRIIRLERKVDFLLRELGLVEKEEANLLNPDPILDEVVALVRQGNKIGAIKLYREKTGVDLKTAKDTVEKLW
jgi:hypothetical protein